MATYGSTLDSLMANRLADNALAARERASYRDYLNAMANTNIRGREQESMDRYRQGELGIRGEDVSGLNQFRTGQIGIGRTDAATRAAAANAQAAYQQSLVDAARVAEQNRLTLDTERNRLFKSQIEAATGIPALQLKAIQEFGGLPQAIKAAPGLFNAGQSENVKVMELQAQQTGESEYQKALTQRQQELLSQYYSDTTGFFGGAFNPNDASTEQIAGILKAKDGMDPYEAALILAEEQVAPRFNRQKRYSRPERPAATQTSQSAGQVYTPGTVGFYPPAKLQAGMTNQPAGALTPELNAAIGTNLISAPPVNQQSTNRAAIGSFLIQQPR